MKSAIPRGVRLTYATAAGMVGPIVRGIAKHEYFGVENLPDSGFILAANHISQIDPVTLGYMLYRQGRIPHFMAKKELFELPALGPLLKYMNHIPVDRSARDGESLRVATDIVSKGEVAIIYPEGTITKDPDYWPMISKSGAVRMALKTGAPLVPVGQWGIQQVLPRGAKKPNIKLRPRPVAQISIGKPLDLSDLRSQPLSGKVLREATRRMIHAITDEVATLRNEPAPTDGYYNPATKQRENQE